MSLKAADLTFDMKQDLLSQIRRQTGAAEYDRLVDALGEDGLIDLALEKMSEATNASTASGSRASGNAVSKVGKVVKTILGVAFFLFIVWLWGREPWSTIFNCVFVLFMIASWINEIIGWFSS